MARETSQKQMPALNIKILLIVHGRPRRGNAREIAKIVEDELRHYGFINVLTEFTTPHRSAYTIAREAKDVDRIGVLGGDGTLREVVAGLGERCATVPIAFVPIGNANVIARELGILFDDPCRSASALWSDDEWALDVGVVNESEDFLAMAGVGFDPIPAALVDRTRKTILGDLVYRSRLSDSLYLFGGFLAMLRFLPTRFSVTVDGHQLPGRRFGSVIVANARTYAKDWSFAPDARPDDGVLNVTVIKPAALGFVFALGYAARRNRLPSWLGAHLSGKEIVISARPFTSQVDGDPKTRTTELRITLRPWRVRILKPTAS